MKTLGLIIAWVLAVGFVAFIILLGLRQRVMAGEPTGQRDFPTQRFYTPDGRPAGSVTTYGTQSKLYDERGRLIGTIDRRPK